MDDDRLPRQLVRLFPFEHEDEARQREDEGETAGGSRVSDDRADGREEASHQSTDDQQNDVEDHHV